MFGSTASQAAAHKQQKDRAKQHAHVAAGLVQRAPKPVLSKRDNIGRVQRHANVDQKRDGRKSCNQADQQQSSADNLDHANQGSNDLRPGYANLDETSDSSASGNMNF
jgi:hypothetical protein